MKNTKIYFKPAAVGGKHKAYIAVVGDRLTVSYNPIQFSEKPLHVFHTNIEQARNLASPYIIMRKCTRTHDMVRSIQWDPIEGFTIDWTTMEYSKNNPVLICTPCKYRELSKPLKIGNTTIGLVFGIPTVGASDSDLPLEVCNEYLKDFTLLPKYRSTSVVAYDWMLGVRDSISPVITKKLPTVLCAQPTHFKYSINKRQDIISDANKLAFQTLAHKGEIEYIKGGRRNSQSRRKHIEKLIQELEEIRTMREELQTKMDELNIKEEETQFTWAWDE